MISNDTRHILGLSGGKDSTALAIYMRDKIPNMEYVFCDTGKELSETYDYLRKIEAFLGKRVIRLNSKYSFDYYLDLFSGFLPSPNARWCTRELKLKPFEKFIGDDNVISYIGIRADEKREGYISTKPNIKARFPFKEDGKTKEDIIKLLTDSGIGMPDYYKWRSRSGCYFCFYQRKNEWVGLKENHPELFKKAKSYEKLNDKKYTWVQSESLEELSKRSDEIKSNYKLRQEKKSKQMITDKKKNVPLYQIYNQTTMEQDDNEEDGCLICHL